MTCFAIADSGARNCAMRSIRHELFHITVRVTYVWWPDISSGNAGILPSSVTKLPGRYGIDGP